MVENAVARLAAAEGLSATDALVRIAEIALAALNRRPEGPPPALRGDERAAVLIHLDASAVPAVESRFAGLPHKKAVIAAAVPVVPVVPAVAAAPAAPAATDGGRGSRSRERGSDAHVTERERPFARIADGPGLPRPVVERLMCACRVRVAVLDANPNALDRGVLDLGRARRVVDDRMSRALLLRDRHCVHPGCTSRHKLEAHHVVHWLYGGRTDMANMVLLCSRHHHAHHDGEFSILRVGGRRRGEFVFRRADGSVLERHVDPSGFVQDDSPPVETEHAHIPDTAVLSKTIGDRLDRAWAVAVLTERRQTAEPTKRSSAA